MEQSKCDVNCLTYFHRGNTVMSRVPPASATINNTSDLAATTAVATRNIQSYSTQGTQRLHQQHNSQMYHPSNNNFDALTNCQVKLQNSLLWEKFYEIGTEMIITKCGRRMFPSLRLQITGLEPDVHYCVVVEMNLASETRHKYTGKQWTPAGAAEPQNTCRLYVHPDSPALGAQWMDQPVVFNKIKLTNNSMEKLGHIVLTSMHRYQPKIHIVRTSNIQNFAYHPTKSFIFPETEFMAVTAYQNEKVTKLKIDNNPFAKGFRESGLAKTKRKAQIKIDNESINTSESIESDSFENIQKLKRIATEPFENSSRSTSSTASVCSSLDDSSVSINGGNSTPELVVENFESTDSSASKNSQISLPPEKIDPYYNSSKLVNQFYGTNYDIGYYPSYPPYHVVTPTPIYPHIPQFNSYFDSNSYSFNYLCNTSNYCVDETCVPQDLSCKKDRKVKKDFFVRTILDIS